MNLTTTIAVTRRLASAVASLVAIGALVVGVPFLLWRLAGWPLPGGLPSTSGIRRALTRDTVSDAALVKSIALVGWISWILLCWSLVVESWATLRGVPAARLRLAGPFQGVARRLVASVSLIAATGVSSFNPGAIAAAAPQAVVIEFHEPIVAGVSSRASTPERTAPPTQAASPSAGTARAGAPPAAEAPTSPTATTYTVQRRDSLWKIAECQLGDPLRWRELWELNRGRDFGGVTFSDPNLIYSGWVLDLPTSVPAEPPPAPPPPIEQRQTPAPPVSTVGPTARESDLPSPGPSVPATNSTGSATTSATARSARETMAATDQRGVPAPPEPATRHAPESIPMRAPLFAGGILLASALIALLTRLRRSQARRRPVGRAPHLPPATTAPTETSLRNASDLPSMDRAFSAIRAFAAGLGNSALPPVAAVRVGDTEVEVLLTSPAAVVPPGFDGDPSRRAFSTEPKVTTATIEALAGETAPPCPAMVAAGVVGEDLVLIDVETAGLLTINGPDAADTVRRIAAELATSPASELIEVLVVGDEFDIAGSERLRAAATADDAIEALAVACTSAQAALDRLGDPSTADARRDHSAEEGWYVTVLTCLHPLSESQMTRLAKVARPRCGVAAVVVSEPVSGAWSLSTGPTARLDPHGFDLTPATLSTDELAKIDELLADAASGDSEEWLLGDETPTDAVYLPDPPASSTPDLLSEIEVRVLGPVEVQGVPPINRRRTTELITYLALQPGGVSAERLKTAIWPDAEPSQDTFNVTVHRARSALGTDADGNHSLPHAVTNGGNYSVGPHVVTDLHRFNELVRRARSTDDSSVEADLLRDAIGLLRGQVFEGVRGYEWAFTEAIVTEAEATISDAAHRLAQLELARGDADAANWAATQGLKAVPGSEPLFRDRMEAAHLIGDPAAVDRIVDELCRYIETLEPLDDLHPDTVELWRRLGHPRGAVDTARPTSVDARR